MRLNSLEVANIGLLNILKMSFSVAKGIYPDFRGVLESIVKIAIVVPFKMNIFAIDIVLKVKLDNISVVFLQLQLKILVGEIKK